VFVAYNSKSSPRYPFFPYPTLRHQSLPVIALPRDNALGREEMTAEYLRSITVASLPLGALQLRIGAPLMLMRNLDPQHGLCNDTRMTLLRASRHCLDVRLNGGQFDGQSNTHHCSFAGIVEPPRIMRNSTISIAATLQGLPWTTIPDLRILGDIPLDIWLGHLYPEWTALPGVDGLTSASSGLFGSRAPQGICS
jgi:DNA helicase Pif1-like protein